MPTKDIVAVLYSIENDLRLKAVGFKKTYFLLLDGGQKDNANIAQGIYEGLQTAIYELKEKRRELEENSDIQRNRDGDPQGKTDPQTAQRD